MSLATSTTASGSCSGGCASPLQPVAPFLCPCLPGDGWMDEAELLLQPVVAGGSRGSRVWDSSSIGKRSWRWQYDYFLFLQLMWWPIGLFGRFRTFVLVQRLDIVIVGSGRTCYFSST